MGTLYLIPTTLGESTVDSVIPSSLKTKIPSIKYFIVENIRTARRYLKKVDREINIDELHFEELNKRTKRQDLERFLDPIKQGHDIGVISEAGCPGVADPGADVVRMAHVKNMNIVPLVGPSSILLSLMGSGMNGQSFAFNGYLPIRKPERIKALRDLEKRSLQENQTQIFIEAPYRNTKFMEDILEACHENTRLCIACDLTLETEYIKTKTIKAWRNNLPDIYKRPAIFLIQQDR